MLLLALFACHLGDVNVKTTCDDLPGGCDDLDRDGFVAPEDCDESNGAINPSASDVYGDDIDQNCDGADGVGGDTPDDADHDGFGAAEDCDDGNGAINPKATDVAGDGTDQNCDGADGVDADGDGHPASWSSGDDCDDGDPAVHPGLQDPDVDGVDQNCDGTDGPAQPSEFLGDITLTTDDDLQWFCDQYGSVRGSLTLSDQINNLGKLDCLTSVGGNLIADLPLVPAIRLANLERVGGTASISASQATSFFMPSLTTVGGDLRIVDHHSETINLGLLERVGGSMEIYGEDLLDVNAPSLSGAGGLNLTFPGDATLNFPALTSLDENLYVTDYSAGAAFTLDFSTLSEVGGTISLSVDADALTLPALLTAGSIYVTDLGSNNMTVSFPLLDTLDDASLTYIGKFSAPKLTSLHSLYVSYGNSILDLRTLRSLSGDLSIYATDITDFADLTSLQVVDGTISISNNLYLSDVTALYDVTKADYLYFTYNSPVTDSDGVALGRALNLGSNVYIYGNGPS